MTFALLISIAIILLTLLVGWAIHVIAHARPWWQQPGPTKRQIRRWRKDRVLTVTPQPNRMRP